MFIEGQPSSASTENYGVAAVDDEIFEIDANGELSIKKVVTQHDGTDAEIVAMVAAADAGDIDLTECQAVGDEREVQLSAMAASGSNTYGSQSVGESHVAQTVTMVLMGAKCYTLKTAVKNKDGSDRTVCSFCVGQKNSLTNGSTTGEMGYMNQTNTNSGSQNNCRRRAWCNACYRAAIPSTLLSAFKQFEVKTATEYNASTVTTSDDWFAFFAEKEIFGTRSYSNTTEANTLTAIEYYTTASNRIKKVGDSGLALLWWERSPRSTDTGIFCGVASNGTATIANASKSYGLAPFGCI